MDRHVHLGSWAWVLSASVCLLPGVVCGQDALQNAVQGDKNYRERITPRRNQDQYHTIGAVSYFSTLSYGVEWRDNVLNTETDRRSDFIHRPRFDVNAIWNATQTSKLNFGLGISYTKYSRLSGQNRFSIAPNSEIAWDLRSKDFLFTLYDRMSYSDEVVSQGGITGVAAFPRLDNTAGVRVTWSPSRWVVQTGYGHQNFQSSAATFSYLNRATENLFQRVGYHLAPATILGIEASESLTRYAQSVQADNQSLSAGPYLNWQLTQSLSLNLRGGFVHYSFDTLPGQPPAEGFSSYYTGVEANHILTKNIRHSLSSDRRVQQGMNRGSQYMQSTDVHYNISWQFNTHGSLIGDTFYEVAREPRLLDVEDYTRVGGGIGLHYEVVKHFAPTLRYSYARRDSNLPDRSYFANSVTLSLIYRF